MNSEKNSITWSKGLNFEAVQLPNFITKYMALMFCRDSPLISPFNQIITERATLIAGDLNFPELKKECKDHLLPSEMNVTATFPPLNFNGMLAVFEL